MEVEESVPIAFDGYHSEDTHYRVLGKAQTIYGGPSYPNLEYYLTGSVTFAGSPTISASFLSFEYKDEVRAYKIFSCSMRADHSYVVRPLLCTKNRELKRFLVAVHAFYAFLEVDDQKEFAGWGAVPYNPNSFVQNAIKCLLLAVKDCLSKGLACSVLLYTVAYVWCGPKGRTLKLLFVDTCFEDYVTDMDWNTMIRSQIRDLGNVIGEYFLDPELYVLPDNDSYWRQRAAFLGSFWVLNFGLNNNKFLQMLASSPFLEENMKKIMLMLAEADHAKVSGDCDFDLGMFISYMNEPRFVQEIMPLGTWLPAHRSSEFEAFLRRDAKRGAYYRYDTSSFEDLFICLRNFYQHYHKWKSVVDPGMTLEAAYIQIQTAWPTLATQVHIRLVLASQ